MLKDKLHTIVLTLRSGGDFGYMDVEVLARNIRKQWNNDYLLRVICLCDKITQPYILHNCIMYPTPYKEWSGWWTKMNLFSPEMEQFRPFMYMDLDTAVVNDISDIFPSTENESKFIALGNFKTNVLITELQSGVMWIPVNSTTVTKIWNTWISNTTRHIKTFRKAGDQGFMKETIRTPEAYWQNLTNKITSFKINSTGGWLKEIPNNIAIVCFHGFPRIREASASINWVKGYMQWS